MLLVSGRVIDNISKPLIVLETRVWIQNFFSQGTGVPVIYLSFQSFEANIFVLKIHTVVQMVGSLVDVICARV